MPENPPRGLRAFADALAGQLRNMAVKPKEILKDEEVNGSAD